nr:META domain-containing protein [Marinicella sp. W31]MDC2879647.1 META domain-containing protein [Marinicella sp. W31]
MSKILITVIAALASSSALAQETRIVSGEVTYRERMALPEDAELAVEVLGFQGAGLGSFFQSTGGGQVPLAFEVAVPAGVEGELSAAIMIDNTIAFIGETVAIAAGSDDVDIGTVWVSGFTPSGFQTTWLCGDIQVGVGFHDEMAVVETDDMIFQLPQAVSADGARFASEDGENEFWSKGHSAMLRLAGEDYPECAAVGADTSWTAQGNEPGWRAVIDGERFRLDLNYGDDRLDLSLPEVEVFDGAYHFAFEAFGLSFAVSDRLCRDDMSGRLFPQTAKLTTASGVLRGCGGDTIALLAGAEWSVSAIGSETLAEPGSVTIEISADGRISGSAGCNRYMGAIRLGGEGGLEIGPLAATTMACDAPLVQLERQFFAAIGTVDSFDIGDDGKLLLTADGETVIRAGR